MSTLISCFKSVLEELGIYEPELTLDQAKARLEDESQIWIEYQLVDKTQLWANFQKNSDTSGEPRSLVTRAIEHLTQHDVEPGVAVDLGCGISTTPLYLLERGWTVYAVDNSEPVIQLLNEKFPTWISKGKLILVNQSIEAYEFPENVQLIAAIEALTYCDPKKVHRTFLKIKEALSPGGVFVGNLFPYRNPVVDSKIRNLFGGWMTTKNVVAALMRSTDFPSWSVEDGYTPGGTKQFHIFATN